jgi:hypothetical protein
VQIGELFQALWQDYTRTTPQAARVHELLAKRGERIVNDHIAFRTFSLPEVEIEALDQVFVAAGYEAADSYEFPEKKLFAYHYEHEDPALPKIFLSELLIQGLSASAQSIIRKLVAQLKPGQSKEPGFIASGRPWTLTFKDYEALAAESEYAAWVSAFGFRANHFTVLVNELKTFDGLAPLNQFLKDNGFALNQQGGEIKGSPKQLLEQSSTLADAVDVAFDDGNHRIPSCYYEFARRYPTANGELFRGFIKESADKIFESTNRQLGSAL